MSLLPTAWPKDTGIWSSLSLFRLLFGLYRGDRYISKWFGQWLHDRFQTIHKIILTKANKTRQFQQTIDKEEKQTNWFLLPKIICLVVMQPLFFWKTLYSDDVDTDSKALW